MLDRIRREFEELYGSHTPESYRARLWDWFREGYTSEFGPPPSELQPERMPEELAARRIGDAERIACALLIRTRVVHPIAAWWIERIVGEPTFARHLDECCSPEDWLEFLRSKSPDWDPRGLHVHTTEDVRRLFDRLREEGYAVEDIWDAILHHRAHPESTPQLRRRIDRAAVILGTAVVEHRLCGEPDTEQSFDLYGVATVTTSLAAAVADFYKSVVVAYSAGLQRSGLGQ